MTKILFIPSSLKQIEDSLEYVDGVILSIDGLSINSTFYVNLSQMDEIDCLLKGKQKELFISLNKNMFNKDLDYLEEALIYLSNLNIKGVLYYDISVLSIVKRLNLNIDLVWSQEHFTTNYLTCNYYYNAGCKYTYLSGEITLQEICEIKKKTHMKLMVPIFGYIPMFASIRHIANNYIDYFGLDKKDGLKYIVHDNHKYPILDDKLGTVVYSSHIINGLEEFLLLKKNNLDYVTINSFNIPDDKMLTILDAYCKVDSTNIEILSDKLSKTFSNLDKGFLYKETIYKVK